MVLSKIWDRTAQASRVVFSGDVSNVILSIPGSVFHDPSPGLVGISVFSRQKSGLFMFHIMKCVSKHG